jgi:hypothetical protein
MLLRALIGLLLLTGGFLLIAGFGEALGYRNKATTAYETVRVVSAAALPSVQAQRASWVDDLGKGGQTHYVLTHTAEAKNVCDALLKGTADLGLVWSTDLNICETWGAVGTLREFIMHILVPATSKIGALRDIGGKRVGLALEEPAIRQNIQSILESLGIAPPITYVADHNRDLEQAFLDGEIDVAIRLTPLRDPEICGLLDTGYFRLISLPEAEGLAHAFPGVQAAKIPVGAYGPTRRIPSAEEGPVLTLGVDLCFVAHTEAPPDLVNTVSASLAAWQAKQERSWGTPSLWKRFAAVEPSFYTGSHRVGGNDVSPFVAWAMITGGLGLVLLAFYVWLEERRTLQMVRCMLRMEDVLQHIRAEPDPETLGKHYETLERLRKELVREYTQRPLYFNVLAPVVPLYLGLIGTSTLSRSPWMSAAAQTPSASTAAPQRTWEPVAPFVTSLQAAHSRSEEEDAVISSRSEEPAGAGTTPEPASPAVPTQMEFFAEDGSPIAQE